MKWAPRAPASNAVCGSEIEEEPTEIQASKHARSIRHRASDGHTWRVCVRSWGCVKPRMEYQARVMDKVAGLRLSIVPLMPLMRSVITMGFFVSQVAFAAAAIV